MIVKYISNRYLDKLAPGDEIDPEKYSPEHLDEMVKLGIIRREVEDAPKQTAKKSAKKSAQAKTE